MFCFLRRFAMPIASAAIALMLPASLHADTIHVVSTGVTGSGPNYTYNFQITLDGSGQLVTGTNTQTVPGGTASFGPSFVTLYDIAGLNNVGQVTYTPDVAAASFSSSVNLIGQTPLNPLALGLPLVVVTDNPSVNNVTLTFTGPSPLTDSSLPDMSVNNESLLGTLSITTNVLISNGTVLAYTMQDNANPGGNDEALSSGVVIAAPAPASLWGGAALLGVMGVFGMRRRMKLA